MGRSSVWLFSPSAADVQVFDGEVELQPSTETKQILTAGEGVRRTREGAYQKTTIVPESFLDIVRLEARASGQQLARFERWEAWSERLRSDERLIAFYTFDQPGGWERKLHSSIEPNNDELDGAIVGARRVGGRWQGKAGLEFKGPADRGANSDSG